MGIRCKAAMSVAGMPSLVVGYEMNEMIGSAADA